MSCLRRFLRSWPIVLTALFSMGATSCLPEDFGSPFFHFRAPFYHQLSQTGQLEVELRLPFFGVVEAIQVTLETSAGEVSDVPVSEIPGQLASGQIEISEPGVHRLEAVASVLFFGFLRRDLHAALIGSTESRRVGPAGTLRHTRRVGTCRRRHGDLGCRLF